jgi:hypothetical protein
MCVIDLTNVESIYTYFIEIYLKLSLLNGELSCRARKVDWWEIILQSKKSSLMRNYPAEQEKHKFHYLKSNPLMWNYLAEQEKRIAFKLLIIDKCLMTIEPSSKGRNPNITPQTRNPRKRGRIILVVVCKSTFLDWVVWFRNCGIIICVIFWGGLKINLQDN